MTDFCSGCFLFTLVHVPSSLVAGRVLVSLRRCLRSFPFADSCCDDMLFWKASLALKSPVRIILESCLSSFIWVVRALNWEVIISLFSFSCKP